MTDLFEFDEIGVWSELKLEIVEKYGSAYTSAFKKPASKSTTLMASVDQALTSRKQTGEIVEGSPARALKVSPPFDGYHFIDLGGEKTDFLRSMCGNRRRRSYLHRLTATKI